jgi:hypothetical protein
MNLDGIAVIIFTPLVLLIAFGTGAIVRGILIKDDYRVSISSIVANICLGIIALMIIHFATR